MSTPLLELAVQVLSSAQYRVGRTAGQPGSAEFESDTILGFVATFPTVAGLLEAWKHRQDGFLHTHRRSLRKYPAKASNVYSVFLTSERSTGSQAAELRHIGENFVATRKIVAHTVVVEEDVRRSLAPLLPLAITTHQSWMEPEAALRSKLTEQTARLLDMVVDDQSSESDIANWLLERAP